jgi:hypothetical protein
MTRSAFRMALPKFRRMFSFVSLRFWCATTTQRYSPEFFRRSTISKVFADCCKAAKKFSIEAFSCVSRVFSRALQSDSFQFLLYGDLSAPKFRSSASQIGQSNQILLVSVQ